MTNETGNEENRIAQSEWVKYLRKHLCIASVGSSTVMSQSGKGRVKKPREYLLRNFDLGGICNLDEVAFQKLIDEKTESLSKELLKPDGKTPNWGASRKIINIYLRLCAMNKDINRYYNLSEIEKYLEIPLDSETVKRIKKESKLKTLPKNFTIKGLTKNDSDKFQEAARNIAIEKRLHRYELDILFWNSEKIGGK